VDSIIYLILTNNLEKSPALIRKPTEHLIKS
jgi:hypothetical protein